MTIAIPNASDIADDAGFTEATLDDNMIRQPALVAHYGQVLAKMQYSMDSAKQMLEIQESKSARALRDEAAADGKKITEALINSTLPTVSEVAHARRIYNQSKSDFEGMKIALEALRHKKDMMVQIGVNRRAEIEGKINGLVRMNAQDDAARDLRQEAKSKLQSVK